MAIGEMIREARKNAHMTQEELARHVGVSTMTIRRIEKNERDVKASVMADLLRALPSLQKADLYGIQPPQEQPFTEGMALIHKHMKDRLLNAYDTLNDHGQIEAVKRVEELTEIPRYTKPDEQESD